MKIAIVTPGVRGARSGNEHTAGRWARFLRGLGHRVTVAKEWMGGDAGIMIALHARKSHASIARFHRLRPGAPLIVVLTGTDLYRDLKRSAQARRSLELASRLVVLQPEGRQVLRQRHRAKTRVVYQSATTKLRHAPQRGRFRVAVVGHLRHEKDPFRAVAALARLPQEADVEVIQLGAALTPPMRVQARRWMRREPRYRWLGSRPHAETLRRIAASRLLVVSSVMEGGANVICEAARIGVPVLASRVSGNVGMLGAGYPGFFTLRDHGALAALIERAADDSAYYGRLKRAVLARRRFFAPDAERAALRRLLNEVRGRRQAAP